MRKGLRLFVFLLIAIFLFSSPYGEALAQSASKASSAPAVKAAKKGVKKQPKKSPASAAKSSKLPAEVINVAEEQKKNLAEEKGKVYDLGNIVVHGEDKTRIKDASRKKTAYLTPDTDSDAGEKKGSAKFVAGAAPAAAGGGELTNTMKAFFEGGAGSDSTTSAAGTLIFERNAPADGLKSRSTVGARGEKTGGYRYKSDSSSLNLNYRYENEKASDSSAYAEINYDKNERNLPGFDRFENNYTNVQNGVMSLDARYSENSQRFKVGVKKASSEFKVNALPVDENYDSSILSLGYSKDIIYDHSDLSLPLTLEFNFQNDALDVRSAQSSSAVSTQFGANAEKALSEKTMLQFAPQVYKNGENGAKIGGSVSFILKENKGRDDKLKARYMITGGRQAKKYDTADFLFSDENAVIWAKDNAGANRFDGKTYENDEKFIQLSADTDLGEDTKISASFRNSKSDGLLYLSDFNGADSRFAFNSFASGASVNRINFKAEHRLDTGLTADASVETVKITDSVNDLMPYVPKYSCDLGLSYKHENGLFTRFNYRIKDEMDSSRNPAANVKVDRFATAGIYADKNFIDNGKIYFKADNIFNADLKLRPGYSYKSRTFGLGVNYIY